MDNKIISLISKVLIFRNNYSIKDLIDLIVDSKSDFEKRIYSNIFNIFVNDNYYLYIDDIQTYVSKRESKPLKMNPLYPKILNANIFNSHYKVYNTLNQNNLHSDSKKILLSMISEDSEIMIDLIKNNISLDIFYEILDNNNLSPTVISSILSYSNDYSIIKPICDKQLNTDNFIKVVNKLSLKKDIYNLCKIRSDLYEDYIKSLNKKELSFYIKTNNFSIENNSFAYEHRKEDCDEIINKIDSINKLIKINNDFFINLIEEKNKNEIVNSINNTENETLFNYIIQNKYSSHIKNEIIKYKEEDLLNVFCNCSINTAINFLIDIDVNKEFKEKVLNLRKEEIQNNIEGNELYTSRILNSDNDSLRKILLVNTINKENILEYLDYFKFNLKIFKEIINSKNEDLCDVILTKDIDEVIKLSFLNNLGENNIHVIIELIYNELLKHISNSNISKENVYSYLSDEKIHIKMKHILLEYLNIDKKYLDIVSSLLDYSDIKHLTNNINLIVEFFKKVNVDIETFIQYGCGSKKYYNWYTLLKKTIYDKQFINVYEYFIKNYYSYKNDRDRVSIFLDFINGYNSNKDICLYLYNNKIIFNDRIKNVISLLFNENIVKMKEYKISNIIDLYNIRSDIYREYYQKALAIGTIHSIKNVLDKVILRDASQILNSVGSVEGLKSLMVHNKDKKNLCSYIEQIINYSTFVELVRNSTDIEKLKKIVEYFINNDNEYTCDIELFFDNFKEEIRKLYEYDSLSNLTKIDEYKDILYDKEFSEKLNSTIYNVSDKNYCFYAHSISMSEDIDELINGISTSKTNFISMLPISCYGQKYFLNSDCTILLYDKIPENNYICSSVINMSSNKKISYNSSEVRINDNIQRGIFETSSARSNNSETLFFREGIKPCALALPGGRMPTDEENKIHLKYNLPYIVTQELNEPVKSAINLFKTNDIEKIKNINNNRLIEYLNRNLGKFSIESEYTGRVIGIITDIHGLFEPTLALLEDMKKNGVNEIYSLGDNIGSGNNPDKVIDILEEYGVISVLGNSEYYQLLGTESFPYLDEKRLLNEEWTKDLLGKRIKDFKNQKSSIDLNIGKYKVGLCHFANDVRSDFSNTTWTYQRNFAKGVNSKQFLYTNSIEHLKNIKDGIRGYDKKYNGLIDSLNDPLFNGKSVTNYNILFQGHVHFEMIDMLKNTKILTLRAAAMGADKLTKSLACYYIIKERKDGNIEVEKKYVEYNTDYLYSGIVSSSLPYKEKILSYLK